MKNFKKYYDKDLIELFLDKLVTEKNLSHTTLSSYNSDLNIFNNFLYKKKISISNCNEEALKQWVSFLVKNKIKSSSRTRKISVIKQFFRFLYEEKFMQINPAANMVLPKKIKTLPKFLSENDINKLLDYMQKNMKTFRDLQTLVLTEILYASGLRVSELVQLKVSSVADDLTHLYIKGKGNKDRVIPLGEYAQKVLKNYLLKIKLKYKNNNSNKKKWLFPNTNTHITRHTYYNKLKLFARKADINIKKISPHVLRHAFASHMLRNGADLKVLQQLLGHEDISTVEIYTHVNIKDSMKALKKHPLAKIDI